MSKVWHRHIQQNESCIVLKHCPYTTVQRSRCNDGCIQKFTRNEFSQLRAFVLVILNYQYIHFDSALCVR